nr:uncharacterized protein LOC132421038 isoform X3 [Delphinus delphis]
MDRRSGYITEGQKWECLEPDFLVTTSLADTVHPCTRRPPCSLPPPPPAGSPPSPRAPAASRLPASRVLPPSGMSCSPGTPCPGRRGTAVAARLRSPPPRAPWSPGEGRCGGPRQAGRRPTALPEAVCTHPTLHPAALHLFSLTPRRWKDNLACPFLHICVLDSAFQGLLA